MPGVIIAGTALYIALCCLVAWIGRNTRLGAWGVLISAFVFTPFITFIFVVLLSSKGPDSAPNS